MGITSSEISALGTRNGILPLLVAIGTESTAGLAGTPKTVVSKFGVQTANPYFDGGIGTALGQVLRRDFPTNRAATYFQMPLHNDQAQADYAIDQLQLRQSQIQLSKDLNQVAVDVSNYTGGHAAGSRTLSRRRPNPDSPAAIVGCRTEETGWRSVHAV